MFEYSDAKKHVVMRKEQLSAGDFSIWLRRTRRALRNDAGSDVPCAGCTACCRSSLFIPVRPGETAAKQHIPAKYLFPAPGLPKGSMLLGYFESGSCPMVVDARCSIYDNRPLTCRGFDCRVLAATGVDAHAGEALPDIARQAMRWHFTYAGQLGRKRHAAVREAARFIREHCADISGIGTHAHPLRIAVAAVKAYRVFMRLFDRPQSGVRDAPLRVTLKKVARELSLFAD